LSGKGDRYFDSLTLNAVFCRNTCPSSGCGNDDGPKENVNWSESEKWNNAKTVKPRLPSNDPDS